MFELPDDDPRRMQWARCESPIEQLLCRGLFAIGGLLAVEGDYRPERRAELAGICSGARAAFVFTQQWLAARRVDFLVVAIEPGVRRSRTLVVEADGRRYHDEESDELRDDELVSCGIDADNILHYTGSEIHSSLAEVVADIADVAGVTMRPAADMDTYGSFWFPMAAVEQRERFRRRYEQIADGEREQARVDAYRRSLETGLWEDEIVE